MIPKKIFFVWLGDNKPNYVDFAINAFRDVNPSFDTQLIHYSDNDIELSKKFEGPISKILSKECIQSKLHKSLNDKAYIDRYKSSDMVYKISLSVPIRYSILKKYGGIYLDCDTFPIKPFDDELLSTHLFAPKLTGDNSYNIDCFFIGLDNKICSFKNPTILETKSGYGIFDKDKKYRELNEKFYNQTLKYGEYYNNPEIHYIDHYWIRKYKYL